MEPSPTTPASPSGIGFRQQSGFRPATGATPPDQRRPIGFFREQEHGAPQPAQDAIVDITVPQRPQPVAQHNGVLRDGEADKAVLFCLGLLKKEPSNFKNRQALPASVFSRIEKVLNDLSGVLDRCETLSYRVGNNTAVYIIMHLMPCVQEAGFNYNTNHIIHRLATLCGVEGFDVHEDE